MTPPHFYTDTYSIKRYIRFISISNEYNGNKLNWSSDFVFIHLTKGTIKSQETFFCTIKVQEDYGIIAIKKLLETLRICIEIIKRY